MTYLLDTNIVSALMKDPRGKVATRLERLQSEKVGTNVVVVGEVEYGIRKKQSERLREQFDRIRPSLPIFPMEEPVDFHYAIIRAQIERAGRMLGQNDLWIAAHSLALDAVVVTDDRAFLAVPGLKIENWLRDESAAG